MRRSGVTRIGERRSWLILLTALGLLLAQGSVLFHLLLVPHRTCEHGELVEVAAPLATPPAPAAATTPRSDQQQIEHSRADGAGHDHCDALAVRHRLAEVGPSIAPATLLLIAPLRVGGDHAETRPVALLSLAPKSSPPVG